MDNMNKTFIIATGNSRKEKNWKNTTITWEEFLDRVKNTYRTSESVEEYKKLSKSKRDEIKDVGGFVGGKLKDGKRRTGCVEYRSMLTLDMDYARPSIWDYIYTLCDYTCCIYSTHSHTPEKPRYRLIIPLARNVSADEYQAIGRKVAEELGIEQFDDTTYEATRLMYWPSTSSDGQFVFETQEGLWLDADKILAQYKDWKDALQWPVSSRQKEVVKKDAAKQADPMEKRGIVGAFCRTYDICGAIDTFLADIYEPALQPSDIASERYTYIHGTTTGGLIVYDNKYAYSHHASDPACNKLCNAFDLVRIHKFGELDEKAKEGTPIVKMPSYIAMQELAVKDDNVRTLLAKERIEKASEDFDGPVGNGSVGDGSVGDGTAGNCTVGNGSASNSNDKEIQWQKRLVTDQNGQVQDSLRNMTLILKNDSNLRGIAFNEHRNEIVLVDEMPWRKPSDWNGCGWKDDDDSSLRVYIEKTYGIWSPGKFKDALSAVSRTRGFHPIKDFLEKVPPWDERKRIDTLLIDYLGAEDNVYVRAVTRKTLCAAVSRIYSPGTQFDHILVLNGPQGIGKSTLFAKLGGQWFSDSLAVSDMKDKTAAEKLQGYWILELAELVGIRKTEVETVKAFITRRRDIYRASYGHRTEEHPRQCIIVGSTNNTSGFLRDVTGNRRFWPVVVPGAEKKPWAITQEDIALIWAEVKEAYKSEKLYLEGDAADIAYNEQRNAIEGDEREGLIIDYLERLLPENWNEMDLYARRAFLHGGDFIGKQEGTVKRDRVCTMELWCELFCKDSGSIKRMDMYELNALMGRIDGWERYQGNKNGAMRVPNYGVQRVYVRTE